MEWTRSPWMRAIALVASLALVVTHWEGQGPWFWVGAVLVLLNLAGPARAGSRAGRSPGDASDPDGGSTHREAQEHRLVDLLGSPGVAAAFAAGPRLWRQVSHLDDGQLDPMTADELAGHVWLELDDDGWTIGLDDEVKPYLDLDLDEADDPVVTVLRAHPAVGDAYHEDREVYRVEQHGPLGVDETAELAARALVAHHVHAARS